MSKWRLVIRFVTYLFIAATCGHSIPATAQLNTSKTLTVLSYNVLGEARDAKERMPALLSLIKSTDADIIALQEVTPWSLVYLLKESWIRNYFYPIKDGEPFVAHGLLILSKQPITDFSAHGLPSHQNRMLLNVKTEVAGVQLSVSTCHLDSYLEDGKIRARQLDLIFRELESSPNSLVLGDFNFGDGEQPETAHLNKNYLDVWKVLYPNDPGYTWNIELSPMAKLGSFPNEPSRRIDQIHFKSEHLQAQEARIIGAQPVSADRPIIFPSDHFGLVARFVVGY